MQILQNDNTYTEKPSSGEVVMLKRDSKYNSEHSSRQRKARREWSELYGREYDQGKVTYNDIYFQQ